MRGFHRSCSAAAWLLCAACLSMPARAHDAVSQVVVGPQPLAPASAGREVLDRHLRAFYADLPLQRALFRQIPEAERKQWPLAVYRLHAQSARRGMARLAPARVREFLAAQHAFLLAAPADACEAIKMRLNPATLPPEAAAWLAAQAPGQLARVLDIQLEASRAELAGLPLQLPDDAQREQAHQAFMAQALMPDQLTDSLRFATAGGDYTRMSGEQVCRGAAHGLGLLLAMPGPESDWALMSLVEQED